VQMPMPLALVTVGLDRGQVKWVSRQTGGPFDCLTDNGGGRCRYLPASADFKGQQSTGFAGESACVVDTR
jgi:hypothetical protein